MIKHDGAPGELNWAPRSWFGHELDLFHPWFLNNLDLQKTLWGKIKCWLELECKFWFAPIPSRPKCPTPISTIKWRIQYNYWGK